MNQADMTCDLMVIGNGMAGMAAALFAARRGLSVVQTGATGGIDFSTGLIDLLGVHPVESSKRWDDPWAAREALIKDNPDHPYAKLEPKEIQAALDEFTAALSDLGLPFYGHESMNSRVLTPAGTVKRTYRVPATLWNGVVAMEQQAPALIVDFEGLKGFSARQIVQTAEAEWPNLKAARVPFPGALGELYPEHMAWTLSDSKNREALAESVREHLGDAQYVGFPAVLGLRDCMAVIAHLEELLGVKVFEVPTLPPSIVGIRLRSLFEQLLPSLGVRPLLQNSVLGYEHDTDGFLFECGVRQPECRVRAKSAILATGRFFGKGLRADRQTLHEAVFDLPVVQPASRIEWHRKDFFDKKGHPVNSAGVATDSAFRPLGADGKPAYETLHAAGAILAHQDWMRQKCGSGLAIATAFKAVESLSSSK